MSVKNKPEAKPTLAVQAVIVTPRPISGYEHWVKPGAIWTFCEAAHILLGFEPLPAKMFNPGAREFPELRGEPSWQTAELYHQIKNGWKFGELQGVFEAPLWKNNQARAADIVRYVRTQIPTALDWLTLPPEIDKAFPETQEARKERAAKAKADPEAVKAKYSCKSPGPTLTPANVAQLSQIFASVKTKAGDKMEWAKVTEQATKSDLQHLRLAKVGRVFPYDPETFAVWLMYGDKLSVKPKDAARAMRDWIKGLPGIQWAEKIDYWDSVVDGSQDPRDPAA